MIDPFDVSSLAALRRDYTEKVVSAGLSLVEARAKAVKKFGNRAGALVADVAGIEQASGQAVAAYKAGRIRQQLDGGTLIADLCCGIGGDSMALAGCGLEVLAVDRDPLRAWMAGSNGGRSVRPICADVSTLAIDGLPIHIDPARRSEGTGRRAWRLEDYQPGPEVIDALIKQSPAAAIKLSPGVDVDELPWPGEVEFISDRGRLVQAVLWAGSFARDERCATLISEGGVDVLSGTPVSPAYAAIGQYLYTFDASIERADLIGPLSELVDAPAVHPKLGLLTSDRAIESPWLTGFEFIETLPWRPKKVKQWLKANDGGLVEVKTRGKACDPDVEQRRLRGEGSTVYTVFVLRFDTKVQALITKRIATP
eukprot:g11996.t1